MEQYSASMENNQLPHPESLPVYKRLQEVCTLLNKPDVVTDIKTGEEARYATLRFDYNPDIVETNEGRWAKRDFLENAKEILSEHNLEMGGALDYGRDFVTYRVYELVVNGRTNWRRWLPYPENLSSSTSELLDNVAEFVGQQEGSDGYEKFGHFVSEGLRQGLLTKDEYDHIRSSIYKAAH